MKKIITHDGRFHADEVFAIALLYEVLGAVEVERTRNVSTLKEALQNPDIWVVDVGGVFDSKLNNFDHHQDPELEASVVLVLEHLYKKELISWELADRLINDFLAISLIDRKGYEKKSGFQVNSLISSFNYIDNGFIKSVEIARDYIRANVDSVHKSHESLELWNSGEVVHLVCRVTDAFPIDWKKYKQEPFLLHPDMYGDEKIWKLHSIDSTKFPLKRTGKEIYFDNRKFLATYQIKEHALDAVYQNITS